jgi:hypothetical protein
MVVNFRLLYHNIDYSDKKQAELFTHITWIDIRNFYKYCKLYRTIINNEEINRQGNQCKARKGIQVQSRGSINRGGSKISRGDA